MNFDLIKHTILLTIAGSRAYGTHTDTSDVDVKGVLIAPKKYYLGQNVIEQVDGSEHIQKYFSFLNEEEKIISQKEKLEGTSYELKKFIKLATDCNPNILDALFCREEEIRLITPVGRKLRDNANLFLSAKARFTFSGYAHSQLKRIISHRGWLLLKSKEKPTRVQFGLPETGTIPKDHQGFYMDAIKKKIATWTPNLYYIESDAAKIALMGEFEQTLTEIGIAADERFMAAGKSTGISDQIMETLFNEKKYQAAMTEYQQYQTWKTNRNPARAALEEKYGYDCKHAMQLVRLQTSVLELMKTGNLNVYRSDRDLLLSIRNGGLTYEELIELSEKLEAQSKEIYDNKTYKIPHKPDINKIDNLCVELIEEFLKTQ